MDGGVLDKREDGYRLTEAGKELWSLLLCIWAWEQRWVQGEALPTMRHTACGEVFSPALHCVGCDGHADSTDVTVELGPSGELARAVPVGRNRRRTGSSRSLGPGLFPETMALMGSRWSSATLGAAFLGASRFRDFEAALGAPPNVVSERLRQFVELDVLRSDEAEGYVLTDKGRDFFPAVTQLVAWGERWHPAAEGPALVATHACGNGFVPQLRCDRCGASLNRATVAVERSRTQQRKSS